MTKKRATVTGNSVPVQLEKATELSKREPILQVDPSVLEGIKSSQDIALEQQQAELKAMEHDNHVYYRNKAYYYAGVFGVVILMWLGFRYFKVPKPTGPILEEIVNTTVSIVPK